VGALSHEDALVDLLVLGMRAHDLTPGRGSLDATLDLLACAESTDTFDAEALGALLRPFAPRLSSALVVTCRWDANRALLIDHLGALNVGTRALVVRSPRAPALTLDARCTLVDADAVRRGERLAL
jgi:hypothetical protein